MFEKGFLQIVTHILQKAFFKHALGQWGFIERQVLRLFVNVQFLWQQCFSSISTRIISSPIWRIQFQGMIYSLLCPKKQKQKRPGPGTIKAVIQPFSQLNSTSTGQPRVRQVQILMTSFCFNSQIRMKNTCFLWDYAKILKICIVSVDMISILNV